MSLSRLTYPLLVATFMILATDSAYAGWPKRKKQSRKARLEELMAMETPAPASHNDPGRFNVVESDVPVLEIPEVAQPAIDVNENIYSEMSPFCMTLLDEALSHLGTRYKYGGESPSAFDCSGFVKYCFRQMGVQLPHSSRDLFTVGENIEFMDEIRPGDLVFFRGRNAASSIGHVGIVTESDGENFSFVHASTSSGVIISRYTEKYYHTRYVGARRVSSQSF